MKLNTLIVLACGLVASASVPWIAAAKAQTDVPACNPTTAKATTIKRILDSGTGAAGPCVKVRAILFNGGLFADVGDLYLETAQDVVDDLEPESMPLAGGMLRDRFAGAARWVEVAGTIVNDDLTVQPVAITQIDRPVARLTGEAARRRFGDLAPMARSATHHFALTKAAAQWFSAVQTAEPLGIAQIFGASEAEARFAVNDPESDVWRLRNDPASPFSVFRGRTDLPQLALFVPKAAGAPATDPSSDEASGEFGALACFCRVADCRRLWPIAAADAGHDLRRPYACVVVTDEGAEPGEAYSFRQIDDIEMNDLGEP
jgi:hypothetical protein